MSRGPTPGGVAPAPSARTIAWGAVLTLLLSAPLAGFSPGRADFSVRVGGETIPYREFAIYVLPGRAATLTVDGAGPRASTLEAEGGEVRRGGPRTWQWIAPSAPGMIDLRVTGDGGGEMLLHAFVVVPAEEVRDGRLRGYRIGAYPSRPFRDLPAYRPPTGFVEVTEANRGTRLSPHFTLEQFLCKQESGYPKFVALRVRLLLKLEYLLQRVNASGIEADTFAVLSGFRTPFYNRAIGNVANSRHQWGDAADVFVDIAPRDGWMDDLDSDGSIDVDDARLLYRIFEGAAGRPEHGELTGGLGVYGPNPVRGPFVHVDARGYRARWGSR